MNAQCCGKVGAAERLQVKRAGREMITPLFFYAINIIFSSKVVLGRACYHLALCAVDLGDDHVGSYYCYYRESLVDCCQNGLFAVVVAAVVGFWISLWPWCYSLR